MPKGGARPNSGGARPGAGRKPKVHPPITLSGDAAPLDFMLAVMRDPKADPTLRAQMAKAAAPYLHEKIGEPTKKGAARSKAASVGKGRFGASAPPKLVINNR